MKLLLGITLALIVVARTVAQDPTPVPVEPPKSNGKPPPMCVIVTGPNDLAQVAVLDQWQILFEMQQHVDQGRPGDALRLYGAAIETGKNLRDAGAEIWELVLLCCAS